MTKARDLANAADVLDDVSATELSYVNGVTSAIQTQLNAKQAVVSGVDDTEIGYLNGVTSAIQTQIDSKIGSASAISPTLIDAKGDLIVGSAADTAARLAVGTNNHVLTADSAATNGVKWAALPASGLTFGNTYTQAEETTTSTQYTNLTTATAVTVTTGTKALVLWGAFCRYANAAITFDVSGATTSTGDDGRALMLAQSAFQQASRHFVITGLTAGSNTFTLKFRSPDGASATFDRRNITVIDLGS